MVIHSEPHKIRSMERWRSTHVINNFDLVTLAKLPPLVEPFRRRAPISSSVFSDGLGKCLGLAKCSAVNDDA